MRNKKIDTGKVLTPLGKFILALCELGCGILLLIDHIGFTTVILNAIGAILLVAGLIGVINYFRTPAETAWQHQGFAKGVIGMLLGGFMIFGSMLIIAAFPLLTVLYGVGILTTGVFKLEWTIDMLRLKRRGWWITGITALISVACAAVMIGDPWGMTLAVWTFSSISMIVSALGDIIAAIIEMSAKNSEISQKEIDVEAESK